MTRVIETEVSLRKRDLLVGEASLNERRGLLWPETLSKSVPKVVCSEWSRADEHESVQLFLNLCDIPRRSRGLITYKQFPSIRGVRLEDYMTAYKATLLPCQRAP